MNQSTVEAKLQKATSIDFNTTGKIVLLIFDKADEATDAMFSLLDKYQELENLALHIQYTSKGKVNLSIIEQDSADTIKIDNLEYSDGKKSYITMTAIEDLMKEGDFVLFWTACSIPSGRYIIPYMEELKAKGKFPLKITNYTTKFISKE